MPEKENVNIAGEIAGELPLELVDLVYEIKLSFQAIEHVHIEAPRLPDPYEAIFYLALEQMKKSIERAVSLCERR